MALQSMSLSRIISCHKYLLFPMQQQQFCTVGTSAPLLKTASGPALQPVEAPGHALNMPGEMLCTVEMHISTAER